MIWVDILACTVCMGAPGDPMVKGANAGIWVLLGIVFFVQIGFVALFVAFWRRARALKRFREQFHVVHPERSEGSPVPPAGTINQAPREPRLWATVSRWFRRSFASLRIKLRGATLGGHR